MEPLLQPPGQAGKAYRLGPLCGEVIYIPCSKSATRLLVTGKESDGAFAVVSSGGSGDKPIGFHYHREAHDVFLCIKGRMNVWGGEFCRTMEPGDFASVPPNTVHQYQVLGDHNKFLGLIVPGGWEEFFRFIGDPYQGPMWPNEDERNVFEVLIPRLQKAKDKYDHVPLPDHPYFEPQPWDPVTDVALPGIYTPYFFKGGAGPRYTFAGMVVSPLIITAESDGVFAVGSIEGSSYHQQNPLAKGVTFFLSHHCFYLVDGTLELELSGGHAVKLGPAESMYIPKQTTFSLKFGSRYLKAYVFSNRGGILIALCAVGVGCKHPMIPDRMGDVDVERLKQLGWSMAFRLEG